MKEIRFKIISAIKFYKKHYSGELCENFAKGMMKLTARQNAKGKELQEINKIIDEEINNEFHPLEQADLF